MIKIKVFTNENFNVAEVTNEVYKILESKVIASVTKNVELQIFLKEVSLTLPKLMETCVTLEMYEEALKENLETIKAKKI
jgi:hypothetical protein